MLKMYKTNNNTLPLQMHFFFQVKMKLIFCTYSLKDIGNYINFYEKNAAYWTTTS